MRARWLIVFALLPLALGAAEIRMLEVEKEDDAYVFDSLTFLQASPEAVFAVLLDYDQYPRISGVYKESRYIEPAEDGRPRVYTRAEGCILWVCRELIKTETLHVTPHTHISAVVESAGSNLSSGRTDWWLEAEGEGTLLHYRIVEKIGEGGMGVVWKALDTKLRRDVAIKLLSAELEGNPEKSQRLEREARVIAALADNLLDPCLLAEAALAHELDLDAGLFGELLRVGTHLVSQRLGKARVVEDADVPGVQVRRHPLGVRQAR